MSFAAYTALLDAFGRSIRLPGVVPDAEGYCALGFDDLMVHLQYDQENGEVTAFTKLGSVDEDRQEAIFGLMLGANVLWQGTRGATISVEPDTGTAFIAARERVSGLPDARFQKWLGDFVDVAEFWTGRLGRLNAGGPLDEGERGAERAESTGAPTLLLRV